MIDGLSLGAAATVGLAGSLHCFAMCGAVAGAFGVSCGSCQVQRSAQLALSAQLGRVASYMLAGTLAGGLGWLVWQPVEHAMLPSLLRSAVGVVLLAMAMALWFGGTLPRWMEPATGWVWRRIGPITRRLLPIDRTSRALAFGAIWGWMPCGLVYAMLGAAWFSASPWTGALLLGMFGFGTLPAMLAVTLGAQRQAQRFRQQPMRRALALGTAVLAVAAIALPWTHPSLPAVDGELGCETALPKPA